MPEQFDPYAVLGVARDATSDQITTAYRIKVKEYHPDAGGRPEDFHVVNRSLSILKDPVRRRRFDETGIADDAEPDNDMAKAAQALQQFVDASMKEHIQALMAGTPSPHTDLRYIDLLAAFRLYAAKQIETIIATIAKNDEVAAYVVDIATRFSTTGDAPNMIRSELERRIAHGQTMNREAEAMIKVWERAIALADSYQFRFEDAAINASGPVTFTVGDLDALRAFGRDSTA